MSRENETNDLNSLTNKFVSTIFKSNYKTQECVKQQFQVIKALNERVAELEKKIVETSKTEENASNAYICNEDEPEASDITLSPVANEERRTSNIVPPPQSESNNQEAIVVESPSALEDESEPCNCNCPESGQLSEEYDDLLLTKNENELRSNESTGMADCNEHSEESISDPGTTGSVETSSFRDDFVAAEIIEDDEPPLIYNHEKNVNNSERVTASAFGNFTVEFTKHLMLSIQPMIDEKKMRQNATSNQISPTDVN